MKRIAALALVLCLSGCYNGAMSPHPYEDGPPDGVTFPKTKYTILVVHGTYHERSQGFAYERYHADVVQFSDNWVIFHDKTLDVNVRTPSSRTTIIGGDDTILPFVKSEH